MTVAELIARLQTVDPSLPVAFRKYSEYAMLSWTEVEIEQLCELRPDGWVHLARPDKPTVPYLVFPGN